MKKREKLSESADPRYAEVLGVRLAYCDGGDGPALVCLHAVGHGSADFAELRARIGDEVRMISLDWPGHGRSGQDSQPASAARYASLLAEFLRRQHLQRPVVLGNSIGAAAAINCASADPESMSALVISDAGGLVPPNRFTRRFCGVMSAAYRRGRLGARWFPAFYAMQYRALLRGPAARAHRRLIVEAGREMAPVLEQAWRSFAAPEADVRAHLERIEVPVLLAWARSDPYNSYKLARPSLSKLARAETRLFAGGHAPFLEHPDAFATVLAEFLAKLPARPSIEAEAVLSVAR